MMVRGGQGRLLLSLLFLSLSILPGHVRGESDPLELVSKVDTDVSTSSARDLLLKNETVGKAVRLCAGVHKLQEDANHDGAREIALVLVDALFQVELVDRFQERMSETDAMMPGLLPLLSGETHVAFNDGIDAARAAFAKSDFVAANDKLASAWVAAEADADARIRQLEQSIDAERSMLNLFRAL